MGLHRALDGAEGDVVRLARCRLVCTLFAVMLCITGLPLIFKDELGPDLTLEITTTAPGSLHRRHHRPRKGGTAGQVVPYLFTTAIIPS